jgi:cytoskeletal protein CcmA (bactofilin family)
MAQETPETVLGVGTRIRGRVTGDGSLVVEGTLEGDIAVRGDVQLAVGGKIAGQVSADEVTIDGILDGDVAARGAIALRAGSAVRGDLKAREVTLEEGAEYIGRLDATFDLPAELEGARPFATASELAGSGVARDVGPTLAGAKR